MTSNTVRQSLAVLFGACAFGTAAVAHQDAPPQQALFTDVSEAALPGVTTTCGGLGKGYILEVNGGGLGLGDFDGDGDLDLVVVDGSTVDAYRSGKPGRSARLYLNDGEGLFTPGGESWRIRPGHDAASWGTGCAIGDTNGDGVLDLVVLGVGDDQLYLGEGGRGFARGSVLPTGSREEDGAVNSWSTSATFFDFDRDGALDLFVVRYLVPTFALDDAHAARWKGHPVMRGPQGLQPVADQLLRGRGDGTFEDVTVKSGIAAAAPSFGLGVVSLDHDGDGHPDLFVANDSTANHLWRNRGDGTFEEVGLRSGVSHSADGRAQASMGIAAGDVDGDGREELFVTNFSGESNTLYFGRKGARFRDRTSRSGLIAPCLHMLGWGTGMQDVDLDGDLDLWVLNGHVYPAAARAGTDTSYAQADQLLLQGGNGRFEARPLVAGPPVVSRAGVQGDLDGDGDLDIVAVTLDGPVRVLRNDAPKAEAARWLGVRLVDRTGNLRGLGAKVSVTVGGRTMTREVRTSAGFQGAAPAAVHFAWRAVAPDETSTEVGAGSEDAVRLDVRWPDGAIQRVDDVAPSSWISVARPSKDGDGK